jgi:hypothetical protein
MMIPIPCPRHVNIPRQYHFVGALLAIAIRSGLPQDFNFPPFFWEYLMTRQISIEAIFGVDHEFHSLITSLKQAMHVTPNAAAIERVNLRFVIQNSPGKEVFLTLKGFEQSVTINNCDQFIALAVELRLNEMRPCLDEISSGLWENFKMAPPNPHRLGNPRVRGLRRKGSPERVPQKGNRLLRGPRGPADDLLDSDRALIPRAEVHPAQIHHRKAQAPGAPVRRTTREDRLHVR